MIPSGLTLSLSVTSSYFGLFPSAPLAATRMPRVNLAQSSIEGSLNESVGQGRDVNSLGFQRLLKQASRDGLLSRDSSSAAEVSDALCRIECEIVGGGRDV